MRKPKNRRSVPEACVFLSQTEGDERPAERTAPTQTDELQPLRGDEPYMPAKRGINASTQLFGDEELFDFADEVSPLVEVLVWKTLEEVQSELVHEGELEEMAAYREACEQRCRARLDREAQAERLEWQRVENMRKLIEFNERRIEEEGLLIRKLLAVEAAERTPFYPLVEGCLDGLQAQGAFIEDNTVAVQTVAMLQLNKDVKARLAQLVLLENATKSLIRTEIFREASSTERVQREHEEHARMRRIRDRRVMDIRRGRLRFTLRVEDVPQPVAPSPAVARSSVRSEEDKNEDESEREENEESSDREDGDGSSPSDPVSSLSGAAVVTQETQVAPRIPRAAGRRETGQASEADRRVRSGPEEAEEAQMKDGEGNTSRRSSDDPQRYVQGSMNVGSVKAGDLPSKEPHQKETWKKRQTLGTSGATDESKTSNLGSEPVNATEDNQQNSGSHINPRFCLTSDLSADAESGASSETETETQADEHSQSQGQGVFSADVVVGPLIVVKCSETRECFTIEEVRGAIWAWISEHVPELAARAHAGFDVVWKNAVQESVAPLLQSFPGELYLKARPAIVVPQGHEQTTEPTDE